MKISADIIEKDIRRDEGGSGELVVKFKPKHWNYVLPFPDTSTNWKSIKHEVLKKCGLSPESQVSICYIDEENDKVRIDSEAEYHEALRVGQKSGNKLKIVIKELGNEEPNTIQHSSGETFSYRELESGEFVVMDKLPSNQPESESVNDQSVRPKAPASALTDVVNEREENSIPSWLTSYTVQLKNELVKEISENVLERVMLMLGNASLTSSAEPEQKPVFVQETERNDDTLHVGIICDNCEAPIRGIRYKCGNCTDYDLCEQCESLPHVHNENHSFLKIRHNQVHGIFNGSVENTVPKQSPSRRSSHGVKTTVIRNTLGIKNRKEEKLMKVMKKIEKYRAKEQSSNCSRAVPTVIWQQSHLDKHIDSRKGEFSSVITSRCPSHDAEFIKDETFPDGIVVSPGLKFCKSWRMRNTGAKPFTSDTVLKYSWGGKKLVPESKEAAVPSLLPGQEGIISVLFTAPTEPGTYTSHWRLFHRGIGFGDPVWCLVQIKEPLPTDRQKELSSQESAVENSEKCAVKQNNVQEGIAQVLTAVQEEQQRGDSMERKVAILSHTATPTNTPFDLSPPKSPEPPETSDYLKETKVSTGKESATISPESQNVQAENYTAGSESDDTISVINLNSSESDTEFVVVPMPMPMPIPFYTSMDVPIVSSSHHQDEEKTSMSSLPEINSAPSTRRASVELVVTPSSLPSLNIGSGKESNASSSRSSISCSTPAEIGAAEGTFCSRSIEPNLIQLDQATSTSDNPEENSAASQSSETHISVTGNHSCSREREAESSCQSDGNNAEASNTINENADNEERMVQVLPEGLVNGALTAAASVYNTARAVITGIQNRNETLHEDWRHSQTCPPPPPPPPSPMVQLIEMGFCNRALNHHLLVKHKGNVEEVVAELVANHDNEWYAHRHSPDSYYVNFN